MRCDPLHRLFLVSLFFLACHSFPLRLYARRSASELMSGSSTDSIRCALATDCAAAGYGIPANAHYQCNSRGFCTFGTPLPHSVSINVALTVDDSDCNSNYTLFSEACWLNGTVSETCNCGPTSPTSLSATLLPTSTVTATDSAGVAGGDGAPDDADEEIETITVTETSLSIITKSTDAPLLVPTPAPSTTSSTRRPKYVTVTQLSISVVPYIPPIISQTRTKTQTQTQTQIQTQTQTKIRTKTKTQFVTVTSVSISTASPSQSQKPSRSKKAAAPTTSISPSGDRCSRTSECTQIVPQNAHRICLKELCKWSTMTLLRSACLPVLIRFVLIRFVLPRRMQQGLYEKGRQMRKEPERSDKTSSAALRLRPPDYFDLDVYSGDHADSVSVAFAISALTSTFDNAV